jgi:hypothetical protein
MDTQPPYIGAPFSPNVKDAAAYLETKQPYIDQNGFKYSLVGYIIESINTAIADSDFYTGLTLLRRAVAEGCGDLHAPCWVDTDGNKYYPPLEYVCVLHKIRLKLDDMVDIAKSMVAAGATLHPELFHQSSSGLEHARKILQ